MFIEWFFFVHCVCFYRVQFSPPPWITLCLSSPRPWWDLSPSSWATCPWAAQERSVPPAVCDFISVSSESNTDLSLLSMQYIPANTTMQGTYIPQYTPVPPSNVPVEVGPWPSGSLIVLHGRTPTDKMLMLTHGTASVCTCVVFHNIYKLVSEWN